MAKEKFTVRSVDCESLKDEFKGEGKDGNSQAKSTAYSKIRTSAKAIQAAAIKRGMSEKDALALVLATIDSYEGAEL